MLFQSYSRRKEQGSKRTLIAQTTSIYTQQQLLPCAGRRSQMHAFELNVQCSPRQRCQCFAFSLEH